MTARKRASAAEVVADIFGAGSSRPRRVSDPEPRLKPPPPSSKLRVLLFLTLVAFFFGGAVVLSTRIFGEAARATSVVLNTEGPASIAPGETLKFTLHLANLEPDRIEDVTLFVHYPDGFRFISAEPKTVEGSQGKWSFQTLEREARAVLEIQGSLFGSVGETKTFEIAVEYRRPGFALRHSVEATYVVLLETPGLTFELTSPGESRPGETFPFKVKLQALEQDLESITLDFKSTPGLALLEFKPAADPKTTTFTIKKLTKGKTKVIEGKAKREITHEAGRITVTLKKIMASHADETVLAERTLELAGLGPPVNLELSAASFEGNLITLGSQVGLSTSVRALSQALENVRVSLFIIGSTLELANLKSDPSSENTLPDKNWTPPPGPEGGALAIFKLGNLAAESEKTVTLSFILPTDPPTAGGKNLPNLFLEAFAVLEGIAEGQAVNVRTNRLPIKLVTSLDLEANINAREDQTFEIVWNLTNGSNSVRDLVLSTFLGEGTSVLAGPTSSLGEAPHYDPDTRKITWNLPWLPAYAGRGKGQTITLSVTVKRDPTLVSKTALVGSTTLTTRDDFTGAQVTSQLDPILTE